MTIAMAMDHGQDHGRGLGQYSGNRPGQDPQTMAIASRLCLVAFVYPADELNGLPHGLVALFPWLFVELTFFIFCRCWGFELTSWV